MAASAPGEPPVFEPSPEPGLGDEDLRPPGDEFDPLAFLAEHWLTLVIPAGLVLSPLAYMALARALPAVALFASSVLVMIAVLAGVFVAAPMGYKITWSRRLEVLAYRLASALTTYLLTGYLVLLAADAFTPQVVPLGWPALARFLPFWPFYLWVVMGCGGVPLFPCPPPPG